MDESPRASTASETQYINFDMAMHKMSNGWEETPKFRRAMQMTLESHEEFEFTMSHTAMKDDFYEPAMEVAPADELFFRGQLLPLQHDPRLQLVHTLSGIKGGHMEELTGCKSAVEEEMAMKLAYEEAFPFAPTDPEGFHTDYAHEEKLSMAHSSNEEKFAVQERNSTMRSRRSDAAIDATKNDSGSSSFRSQHSSYWGSGEKDSRDSSSSSRCSNGSSQDAYLHGAERKALHLNKAMANGDANVHAKYAAVSADDKARHHLQDGNPPLPPASKGKKWSWKTLFTGLRKVSKVWIDDRGNEHGHTASQSDAHKQKKSVFGFTITPHTHRSIARTEGGDEDERQPSKSSYKGSTETKRAKQPGSSSRGRGLAHEEYAGHMHGKYYSGNGGWRGYNFYDASHGGRPGKEKARLGIIAWNARESWQRWVKRPLYGKPSSNTHHHHKHASMHEDLQSFTMKAKSLSSTPLAKSPVRRADNVCHDPEYNVTPAKLYTNMGFAASCPASMRSSPHHSGVLAVVNKAPPTSSLHDLHTAIQAAIAHCKQSQTVNPV